MSKTYRTKPQTFTGEELKISVTVNEIVYPAGSILMSDVNGNQEILSPEEVAADFDEIKPRTRTTPPVTPPPATPGV